MASCASSSASGTAKYSEVVVRRVDSNSLVRLRVYIDGKSAGTLRVGNTSKYRIKNGIHTIFATAYDYSTRSTEVSQFTANGTRHIFSITDTSIVFIGEESINSAPTVSTMVDSSPTLDDSLHQSFEQIQKPIKRRAKVAIINVASDNAALGNYVIEEMTALMVRSTKRFQVIDRRKLEAIRIAKNFDRTSDMEDDFLVSIGSLLGAEVVITGYLGGQGDLRRMWFKALNVRTGVILASSSQQI